VKRATQKCWSSAHWVRAMLVSASKKEKMVFYKKNSHYYRKKKYVSYIAFVDELE
jgi:hypothetical protein